VVSTAILTELRDPRVIHVTVLGVDVAPDFRSAKIRVSIMGDEKQQRLALKGLESARGFLQSRIAEELDLRYTPVLSIVRDDAVKKSIAISRALQELAGDAADSVGKDEEPAIDEQCDDAT
jgi:ribosome-binding factor A